jgi:hypothetical protein
VVAVAAVAAEVAAAVAGKRYSKCQETRALQLTSAREKRPSRSDRNRNNNVGSKLRNAKGPAMPPEKIRTSPASSRVLSLGRIGSRTSKKKK